jgi:NAD+ kinase
LRAHLLVNLFRPDAVTAARRIVKLLQENGVQALADHESCAEIGVDEVKPEHFAEADVAIAIGGDGTLIRAAYLVSESGTPIIGIHYGRFGFVTQVEPEQADETIRRFLQGKCPIDERMMVKAELVRGSDTVAELHALNEVVVQRSSTTRMLTFDVHVDGSQVSRYPADGVMVATPTGSTAYNLSAGGPVVDPRMDALVLTAIMPHTLSSRPLVLRPESVIEIKVESREESLLSADGHSRLHMLTGDFVRITRSERRTRLVCTGESDFYEKLSDRLQWSQGSI